MAQFPTQTNADGVWSLKQTKRFLQGDNYPTHPGAPTSVSATGGNAQAIVTFTAPALNGGNSITQYRVTSTPDNITATGSSSPITITGLTNGTSYTFTVAAMNTQGYGPESSASNSVTPSSYSGPTTIEYLVVAGGGGGGQSSGRPGGGGAGGFRTATGYSVTAGTTYTVTVGGGGSIGTNGSNSVFDTITSIGGGAGSYTAVGGYNGNSGGSGGGGWGNGGGGLGGAGTVGQGNNGGKGNDGGSYNGGGGGGAGAVGADAGGNAGNGGAGLASSIYGSTAYYAGGGGGVGGSGSNGTGGIGGGGDGNNSGVTNRGGGGGGNAVGGSGVVIIRYPDSFSAPTSTTGSPDISIAGGYRMYRFAGSGSITF